MRVRNGAVVVMAALVAAVPARADTPSPPPIVSLRTPIAEGAYVGTLNWPQGRYRFVDGPTNLASQWSLSNGYVELQVVGRSVTGTFSFEMASVGTGTSSRGRSGAGEALITASGVLEGNAGDVCMSGQMAIEGTITVNDALGSVDLPISETLPLACDALRWEVAAASCTTISGEWTVPIADAITASGAQFPTNGTFSLVRVGDPLSDRAEATRIDALLVEMDRIFNSDPFDGAALVPVLRRVAELEGNSALNHSCGQRDPENTRIAGAFVFRLVNQRFLQTEPPDLPTLRWMAYAALNTGVLGSASAQPERAAYLEGLFTRELLRLTDEAAARGDADALARIASFAGQYGWQQVEAIADAEFERVRGGG